MKPYHVLVVDDENMHRQLFKMIVDSSEDYKLAGELNSALMAPSFCMTTHVDLVILDVVMRDGTNGLDAAEKIKNENSNVKILVVTSMPEAAFLRRARSIGVDSFWYKEVEDKPLLDVMNRTMRGESVYPDSTPVVALGLVNNTDITMRELDVLRELVAGCSNQEIADHLEVSVNTVRFHLSTLLSKTGCNSRTDLAIRAAKSGIVVVDD